MAELYLRAGLFVFAVAATLVAIWLGGGAIVGSLIIVAFISGFAGGARDALSITSSLVKYWKTGQS
jgi:hypothetical protein